MKNTYSIFCIAFSMLSALLFTSCEEGATVDVPGPDIDFQFSYSDINQNLVGTRAANGAFVMVAQSDTIKGHDIESFLSNCGQDYTSVVEAATISNAALNLSGDASFANVDSVEIRYQLAGSEDEIVLARAKVDASDGQKIVFSDIRVDKAQAFYLIKNNIIARIYAAYDPNSVNCFKPGITYRFTAKSTLTVKLSALTDGVLTSIN